MNGPYHVSRRVVRFSNFLPRHLSIDETRAIRLFEHLVHCIRTALVQEIGRISLPGQFPPSNDIQTLVGFLRQLLNERRVEYRDEFLGISPGKVYAILQKICFIRNLACHEELGLEDGSLLSAISWGKETFELLGDSSLAVYWDDQFRRLASEITQRSSHSRKSHQPQFDSRASETSHARHHSLDYSISFPPRFPSGQRHITEGRHPRSIVSSSETDRGTDYSMSRPSRSLSRRGV